MERHGVPFGEVLTVEQAWRLANDWFTGRLEEDWRRLMPEEARASFAAADLHGPFWDM